MSPYREPQPVVPSDQDVAAPTERGMIVALALFALVCLLRASGPFFSGEAFGAEPTLALIAAVTVGGFLLKLGAGSVWTRRPSPRPDSDHRQAPQ